MLVISSIKIFKGMVAKVQELSQAKYLLSTR
jgi:hypothetical protein